MLHDHQLHPPRGQLLQRLLVDVADRLQKRSTDEEAELQNYQPHHDVYLVLATTAFYSGHHAVNQQLADPGRRGGQDAEDDGKDSHACRVAAMRTPDKAQGARHARQRRPGVLPPSFQAHTQR